MKKKDNLPVHILPEIEFLASGKSIVFGEHQANHRINFYAIIWCLRNEGDHHIDFAPYPIQKNMIYLLGRNQVHSIPSGQLPSARVIVFSQDFFNQVTEIHLRQLFLPFDNEGIQVPATMVKPLEQLFQLILHEYENQADTNLLLKYITAFLIQLHRFTSQRLSAAAGTDARILRLFLLMSENFRQQRSAAFYAKQLGISAKRINEILREKAGVTMSELLYQLVLVEGQRELSQRELSIKEIAYRLGFSDQSYFARFFKKHTGMSPEQFRERIHGSNPPK